MVCRQVRDAADSLLHTGDKNDAVVSSVPAGSEVSMWMSAVCVCFTCAPAALTAMIE